MTETGEHDPQTTAAVDLASAHFLPPRACADLIQHALPDLRRARDRIQYVPHNQRMSRLVAELEDTMMLMRTERHR